MYVVTSAIALRRSHRLHYVDFNCFTTTSSGNTYLEGNKVNVISGETFRLERKNSFLHAVEKFEISTLFSHSSLTVQVSSLQKVTNLTVMPRLGAWT